MRAQADHALPLWICSWLALGVAFPQTAASNESDPLAALKAGEWYEVPNSHLKDIAAPASKFPWLSGGIEGITGCWAGGAFDSQRDRLYVGPGGGHAGYNGNEIYAFDLNDLKWHRLNDPDPVIPGTEYTDLNTAPFAMHTYDGIEYLPPPVDRYVVVGGWGTPRTYALNPDRPDRWEVYPDHGTGRTGDLSGYDPIGGALWLSTPTTAGKLSQWDPLTHRWTLRRRDSPDASYYETADVDWKRRLLVACGRGKLKTWALTSIPGAIEFTDLKTSGDSEVMTHPSPGFCYVPLIDKFVAWASGPDVYTLDLDANRWTRHAPAATNSVLPGPPDQWGTFGRFRYVASRNVFIVCNAVNQNVFVYRLTDDRPNIITSVEAQPLGPLEVPFPAAALRVHAVYADGTRRDVTDRASYFSLDTQLANVELHGGGVVRGLAPGVARIRAVYSDPAFNRGFAHEVAVTIRPMSADVKLEALSTAAEKLTIVSGDSYLLEATATFARGSDRASHPCTTEARWSSNDPQIATVSDGQIKALGQSGRATIRAQFQGRSASTEVTVCERPTVQRIAFQVKDIAPRPGWNVDNGQAYSEQRGFGWLNIEDLSTRDDRNSARAELLKRFVRAKQKPFKVKVAAGPYLVRIAMGDSDYGAPPFEEFTALDGEKLIYYEGQHNDVATRIVTAGNDGLTFAVNGSINYLIVAPLGIDLKKYADDSD